MEAVECPECYGRGAIIETFYGDIEGTELCERCGGMGRVMADETVGLFDDCGYT